MISENYLSRDSQRGTPKTFMWFTEEIGELATALVDESTSQEQKESEFADVLAWLCTLANINGVDIEKACREKYLDNPPQGFK